MAIFDQLAQLQKAVIEQFRLLDQHPIGSPSLSLSGPDKLHLKKPQTKTWKRMEGTKRPFASLGADEDELSSLWDYHDRVPSPATSVISFSERGGHEDGKERQLPTVIECIALLSANFARARWTSDLEEIQGSIPASEAELRTIQHFLDSMRSELNECISGTMANAANRSIADVTIHQSTPSWAIVLHFLTVHL